MGKKMNMYIYFQIAIIHKKNKTHLNLTKNPPNL